MHNELLRTGQSCADESCQIDREFESRVLRRISEPRRDGVRGKWRRLHNEELLYLSSSQNICVQNKDIEMSRVYGTCVRKGVHTGFW